MTGDLADLDEDEPKTPAWHERTPTLVGASAAALLALFVMYFAVSCVSREFNTPNEGPQYFLDPGSSSSQTFASTTATTSTTSTITSTSPPLTSDINPGDTVTTSDTSGATTNTRRPRYNQTRTTNLRPFSP